VSAFDENQRYVDFQNLPSPQLVLCSEVATNSTLRLSMKSGTLAKEKIAERAQIAF
jgi:hypothetical protein